MPRPYSFIFRVIPDWTCRLLPLWSTALIPSCRSTVLAQWLKSLARCAQPRVRATLLGGLASLTLLLAAVGVGGVMSQMLEQRRRDIGIRMALGALASDIQRFVLTRALRLTLVGMAMGLLAAVFIGRLLRSFLFGVSILDPLAFAAVVVLLPLFALLAAYLPARRATKLDPIVTLRAA